MGINSQGVAYNFGQMGSGHLKSLSELHAPEGKVIVAITTLEAVKFAQLVADRSFIGNGTASTNQDGVISFGSGAQIMANGRDDDGDATVSAVLAATVEFPAGLTIYGRWTSVQLTDFDASGTDAYGDGIIIYYGPA